MRATGITQAQLDSLPAHERTLLTGVMARAQRHQLTPAFCFRGPATPEMVNAIERVLSYGRGAKFMGTDNLRWSTTVTDGSGLMQGQPVTITYSFVPDGTDLLDTVGPQVTGESTAGSNLFAAFNAAFGSASAWQDKIRAVFNYWSQESGITYVETTDDGAPFPTSDGVLNVRGDIRIGGHNIDGSVAPDILAYNYYPNTGDMVIDTSNTAFFTNSNLNYQGFRNTISHEHGHGMGFNHVCPDNGVIIMEPVVPIGSSAPDMLSPDDIAHAQRLYGDPLEENGGNDTSGTADNLGNVGTSPPIATLTLTQTTVSIDSVSDVDFFKFTAPSGTQVTVTVQPEGGVYNIGPQPTSPPANDPCGGSVSASFDLLTKLNLDVQVLDTDGTTVLATADTSPAGVNEVLSNLDLPGAGTYYMRVYTNDANTTGTNSNYDDQVQMYQLSAAFSASATSSTPIPTVPSGAPVGGAVGLGLLAAAMGGMGAVALRRRRKA